MKAYFQKHILKFKKPAGTSRGVLLQKPSWYIYLYNEDESPYKGIGEVSILPGLSIDNELIIEQKLSEICASINNGTFDFRKPITDFPAINFGVEMAMLDYKCKGSKILFPSEFTKGNVGISTNGLIWMGKLEDMQQQISQKIDAGFRCLKIKIGAINIDDELRVLKSIRQQFSVRNLELRVDANGAFSFSEAREILKRLSDLEVHSIEQPILASQVNEMAALCENPPIPIALDEELIGKYTFDEKQKLIEQIRPQFLILKPSLLGGFKESADWINIAKELGLGWWATSALESNIGLNAIAQWVAMQDTGMYQGLGLGNLYEQNIQCPLRLVGEKLFYKPDVNWNYEFVY
jgi:o-succinylbenzoate synthase